MFAYALALLAYLRSTQEFGATRRVLSVIYSITWMEACIRVWPAHTQLLRAVAVMAAESDLMGMHLDGVWSILVPMLGCTIHLSVPYVIVICAPDLPVPMVFVYLFFLASTCAGYGFAHSADTKCTLALFASMESVGLFAFAMLLGIN